MLGGGSNVVLAPDVRAVVGLMHLRGRRIQELPDSFRVTARAGEPGAILCAGPSRRAWGAWKTLPAIPGLSGLRRFRILALTG
ncbi:hypothetical protein FGK64_10840 [Arenibacterium halophilum]|uniref:Uncharacterized protein n=1 Tax=Arenibacterium halophilum TaxID=2583821 RepID=A0ABY2XA44_9RHOB|nr:hypothetical protein FGK64_10840 [Arenibacterium halophilum]